MTMRKVEQWLTDKVYEVGEAGVMLENSRFSFWDQALPFSIFLFKAGFAYFVIYLNMTYVNAIWDVVARVLRGV